MVSFLWVLRTTNDRLASSPLFSEKDITTPPPYLGMKVKDSWGRIKLIQGYCQDP